jgi:hypothetical protein
MAQRTPVVLTALAALLQTACALAQPPTTARTYYVAPSGNDGQDGLAAERPFRTIQHAADVMQPGDTCLIRAGVYREKVVPPRGGTSEQTRITYRAYAGETPVIKGSERVTTWVDQGGGVWMADLPAALFKSSRYNPFATVMAGACLFQNDARWTLGMVYLDGQPYSERKSLAEVQATPATWHAKVGPTSTTIFARFDRDPNVALAEVNVRDSCFDPGGRQLNCITLHGLTLQQAAPQWSGNAYPQQGLVSVYAGQRWTIERCLLSDSPCAGIALATGPPEWYSPRSALYSATGTVPVFSESGHHLVRHNTIERCGQAGIVGMINGHSSVIEGNLIQDINWQQKVGGAESAGIKLHWAVDVLIKNNVIRRIHTTPTKTYSCHFGLWLDWSAQGSRVTGNLIYDVFGFDKNPQNWSLYLEADPGPVVVDNNIIIRSASNLCSNDNLQCVNCVFAHNLVVAGGLMHWNDSERDFPWFEPNSFRFRGKSKGQGMVERYVNRNNIYMNNAGTNADKDRTGNVYYAADRGFNCTSTPDGAVISFTIDDSAGVARFQPVSHESVGLFAPMNQGMTDRDGKPYDLDTDMAGVRRAAAPVTAGPFAVLARGRCEFTIAAGRGAARPVKE